jgi:hypothetical protein
LNNTDFRAITDSYMRTLTILAHFCTVQLLQVFLRGRRNKQEEADRNYCSVCDSGWRRSSGSDTYANKG